MGVCEACAERARPVQPRSADGTTSCAGAAVKRAVVRWIHIIAWQALQWQAAREPQDIICQREAIITALEEASERLWRSGVSTRWYDGCDQETLNVCSSVNGHLMYELLRAAGYDDARCVEMFRTGTSI